VVAVAYPNCTVIRQYSHNMPGSSRFNGLVYQEDIASAGKLMQWTSYTREIGDYNSPRPTQIVVIDELSQTTVTTFSYGQHYSQVTDVREYDYGAAAVLRRVHTEYVNDAVYTDRPLFNLPKVVEVYEGGSTLPISRTEYTYDGQPLADAPGVVQHHVTYNPHAPRTFVPESCHEECDPTRRPPVALSAIPSFGIPLMTSSPNIAGTSLRSSGMPTRPTSREP
jgi:hypothetical protein